MVRSQKRDSSVSKTIKYHNLLASNLFITSIFQQSLSIEFPQGFGSSDNSADYPLHIQNLPVQKPFTYRHGESKYDFYTEAFGLDAALIHDPNNFIKWENGADIQVTYATPDSTWMIARSYVFLPEGISMSKVLLLSIRNVQ